MSKKFSVLIKKKIKKFNQTVMVESDKSISHRALLISSQCIGKSVLNGVLESDDVENTIACLKNLGVKIIKKIKNILFTEMDFLRSKILRTKIFMQGILVL